MLHFFPKLDLSYLDWSIVISINRMLWEYMSRPVACGGARRAGPPWSFAWPHTYAFFCGGLIVHRWPPHWMRAGPLHAKLITLRGFNMMTLLSLSEMLPLWLKCYHTTMKCYLTTIHNVTLWLWNFCFGPHAPWVFHHTTMKCYLTYYEMLPYEHWTCYHSDTEISRSY